MPRQDRQDRHNAQGAMQGAEMSADTYLDLASLHRRKYGNVKTKVDGIEFDSAAEARRYGELILMERTGVIDRLEMQPSFPLVVNGVKIGRYTADFRYVDTGTERWIVEDVKSPATKTRAYVMRRKLMKALYGIDITEVEA